MIHFETIFDNITPIIDFSISKTNSNIDENSSDSYDIIEFDRKIPPKCNYFIYCVNHGDTIEKIAAKFLMTPNSIISINKLFSRTLFVNQKIKVINPFECNPELSSLSEFNIKESKEIQTGCQNSYNIIDSPNDLLLSHYYKESHLKILAKCITDSHGSIKGNILVTPAFFKFIPALSDPIVIEFEIENFSVHLPRNKITFVYLYDDLKMISFERSKRNEMARINISQLYHENLDFMETSSTLQDELSSSNLLEKKNSSSIENSSSDMLKSISFEDILNKSILPETLNSIKYMDHKYLCVVTCPNYCKINMLRQKDNEYWFMVPTNKAQSIMDYLLTITQTKYFFEENSDLEVRRSSSGNNIQNDDILSKKNEFNLDINFHEDFEISKSKILNSSKYKELVLSLPLSFTDSTWKLLYTTDRDGWSLSTLYANIFNSTRESCLLLIEDSNSMVFGAMCSSYIHMSNSFYGNGMTFIFRWNPNFEKFNYSKRNDYFLFGQQDFFAIGSSNGNNAIRIDKNLFHGETHACETFDSPPLVDCGIFNVSRLEIWSYL